MSVATRSNGAALAERLIIGGDLSALKPPERLEYYRWRAGVLGIDWRLAPFDYLATKGKLALYLNAVGCELLRKKLNITITDLQWRIVDSVIEARVVATTADGRSDVDVGLVNARGVSPSELPDQIAKAITKAKNRVTKSLAGFSSEEESGPDIEMVHVTKDDVARIEGPPVPEPPPAPAEPTPVYVTSRLTHEQQLAMFGAAVERQMGGIFPLDLEQEPGTQTWQQVLNALTETWHERLLEPGVIDILKDGRIRPGQVWRAVLAIPVVETTEGRDGDS